MPIIKSAIKRAKQTVVRRERNVATKRALKDATKAFHATPTAKTLAVAHGAVDTAVKKNVLTKNTAARRKAMLSKQAKVAGVKLTSAKKPVVNKTTPKTATKATPKKASSIKK